MNDLNLLATQSTPSIQACWKPEQNTGTLEMRGDSYPENPFEFFAPLITWAEAVLEQPESKITVELHLLYLNTSSVKALMDILDLLEEAQEDVHTIEVRWYYAHDNARIAELAAEFKEDCTFPFEIVALPA